MIDPIQRRAVLDRIAVNHGFDPEAVSVSDKGAVFYRRGEELLCLCQQGSHYWNEIEAEVMTNQAIERASRKKA